MVHLSIYSFFIFLSLNRMASLLSISDELTHRKYFPPLSRYLPGTNWNLKEFLPCHLHTEDTLHQSAVLEHRGYYPEMYQDRMKKNPELPFHISKLFNAHKSITNQPYETSYLEPTSVRTARVEMTTPYGSGHPELIGISGLPSNELQEYIKKLGQEKLKNNDKYSILTKKLHPSALAAVGVIVEELTSDLMETWRQNIREKLKTVANRTSPSPRDQLLSKQKQIYQNVIHSQLPNNLSDLLINQMDGMLPGPFEYSNRLFERYAKLQIQGMSLHEKDDKIVCTLKNRMEVN